jgi:hypothetical protein
VQQFVAGQQGTISRFGHLTQIGTLKIFRGNRYEMDRSLWCFSGGIGFWAFPVWLLSPVETIVYIFPVYPEPAIEYPEPLSDAAVSPEGISVMYAGWARSKDARPYLKFAIYNGLGRPVSYSGFRQYILHDVDIVGAPMERIWECQIGNMDIYIAPGQLAEVHVGSSKFSRRPRKTDSVTVDLYLWDGIDKEPTTYTTEPFLLPEPFRQSIDTSRF